jgi:CrcB protein
VNSDEATSDTLERNGYLATTIGGSRKGGVMGDGGNVVRVDSHVDPTDTAEPAHPRHRRLPRHRRGRAQPDVMAVIALGGMVGSAARYGLAQAIPTEPGRFPWATFWTNLSGSFVLGFLLILLLERFPPTRYLRPFLATGIIGAYTTMSTYLVDTAVLVKDGHVATGLLYGIGSLAAGLFLAYAGIVAARLTPERHHHDTPRPEGR